MDKEAALAQLAEEIRACRRCPLGSVRTRAVPGEGDPQAEIMFVGEAPGYHEDRQGRPFVGNSGAYLESLLADIHLTRDQVYICNVIKCRPPHNRDPLPQEIEACKPYLQRQIEIIDPLIIITLGRFSMYYFLPNSPGISRVHGKPADVDGRIILPLFHPAAALRNPKWDRATRQDFAQIPALLAKARAARAQSDPVIDDFEQLSLWDGMSG